MANSQIPSLVGSGIVSTGDYESHPAWTVTGDTLFFLKSSPDLSTWTICVSFRKKKSWSVPRIAHFSGQYMDADPFITRDGKELYFISNRSLTSDKPKDDMDIWKITKTSRGWGLPERLPEPINSNEDEFYPTLTDAGTLYFGSKRKGGDSDIYKAEPVNGSYVKVENLDDAINTSNNEYEPFIAPDESYLIFMATAPNGLINGDFYYSLRRNGVWSKAVKLEAPFNSSATEWSPKVSRDGKWFYFGSTRSTGVFKSRPETTEELNLRIHSPGNGLSDIYQIEFSWLQAEFNKNKP